MTSPVSPVCSCQCIDLKSLCVAEEKLCWALYVDVVCLCDNGNVYDATYLAATAALKNSEHPKHNSVLGGKGVIREKESIVFIMWCHSL